MEDTEIVNRTRLGVNVDHVATLRQQRGTKYPEPVHAALIAEAAGCDQITVHLREDRRHIQERDVTLLRETVQTELNLEMAASDEMVSIALRVDPDIVTLVPERREERTTEGGLDVVSDQKRLTSIVTALHEANIAVSMFIDPDESQISASKAVGADAVELHTGDYAEAVGSEQRNELERIRVGAALGARLGLAVAAGHGLDYRNTRYVSSIPEIEELNIGHSIVCRAVFVGFEAAVIEMIDLIRDGEDLGFE